MQVINDILNTFFFVTKIKFYTYKPFLFFQKYYSTIFTNGLIDRLLEYIYYYLKKIKLNYNRIY